MLQKICGTKKILPATYDVSGTLSIHNEPPRAHGGFCDAFIGTLRTEVCVKKLRVYTSGSQDAAKEVARLFHAIRSLSLMIFEAVLQGSCCVETSGPPKCCTLHGLHT